MTRIAFRVKRAGIRYLRRALHRYASAAPRPADYEGADKRVLIVLISAWGMGGTIRAAHNLAGHLAARGYDVEMTSVFRLRGKPFFGSFPEGVKVTALDDHRPDGMPLPLRPVRALLRRAGSVLAHPADRHGQWWNLWVDVRLAHKLRRRTGFLVTTRPSLNLIAAQLQPPGLITVGQEQINLKTWDRVLRRAMARHYHKLDALVALTDGDVREYDQLLEGRLRLAQIPNTVYDIGGPDADLDSTTVLAAGRLTHQKGFDLLIPAWAQVAAGHPGWRLKIVGKGDQRAALKELIKQHRVGDSVELAGPASDMGAEFANASMFVLSSRFEGFPLILIEAMSKGLAVVAFDCPTGPSDIVEDHENGLLVPPRDVGALAAAMGEMMGDDELRRRCAAAATDAARAYSIESVGPQWEELFEALRESRNGRPHS